MTNGSIAITDGLLLRAHLKEYVDLMMDITQPKAWKPNPAAYHYAVKQLNLTPEQVCTFMYISYVFCAVQSSLVLVPTALHNVQWEHLLPSQCLHDSPKAYKGRMMLMLVTTTTTSCMPTLLSQVFVLICGIS